MYDNELERKKQLIIMAAGIVADRQDPHFHDTNFYSDLILETFGEYVDEWYIDEVIQGLMFPEDIFRNYYESYRAPYIFGELKEKRGHDDGEESPRVLIKVYGILDEYHDQLEREYYETKNKGKNFTPQEKAVIMGAWNSLREDYSGRVNESRLVESVNKIKDTSMTMSEIKKVLEDLKGVQISPGETGLKDVGAEYHLSSWSSKSDKYEFIYGPGRENVQNVLWSHFYRSPLSDDENVGEWSLIISPLMIAAMAKRVEDRLDIQRS